MQRFLVPIMAMVALGCGDGGPGQKGLCPEPGPDGPVALFDIFQPGGEELAPFPSDLKTVPDDSSPTGRRLVYSNSLFSDALCTLDGFGLQSVLLVPYARSIDPGSLPATPAESVAPGSPVFLLDIGGLDGAETGTLESRKIPVETGSVEDDMSILLEPSIENAIAVRAVEMLEPVHTYGLVVTACVTAPDGSGLGTQETFKRIRDRGGLPEEASPDGAADLERTLGYLEREGYHRSDLAMVTTFTTQDPDRDLVTARAVLDAHPAPGPVIEEVYDATVSGELNPDMLERMPGVEALLATFDLASYRFDRIDKVVFGTFEAPSFVNEDDLVERDPDTWDPHVTSTETLEFILTLPRAEPAEGIGPPYRVLVYQHAMGVCKETIIALADTMARFGIAVVGIDAMQHGSRHPDGPGGCELAFGDFFSFENFARTSAYFEQSVFDIWSLVRMITGGDPIDVLPHPGGDGSADLDGSGLAFAGQSMGASMGINAMALEPEFGAGVINVGMGGLFDLMLASFDLDLPDEPLPALADYNLFQMNMAVVVPTIADRADPIHWADNLILDPVEPWREAPLSILYQQAALDEVVPFETTARTAALMGVSAVEPLVRPVEGLEGVSAPVSGNVEGGHTAALFQFDSPAEHAFLLMCEDPAVMFAGQLQMAVFLSTWFETSTPVVIDPFDEAQVSDHAPHWIAPPP